jgi:hypothetical protein
MRAMADILTAGTGKIDLLSKAQLGGDLGAVAGHDRSGPRGAVDGSIELWLGAFRQGAPARSTSRSTGLTRCRRPS